MRRWRRSSWLVSALVAFAGGLTACDRGPAPRPGTPTTREADFVALPERKPEYSFAAGLAEQHPQVVGFLRHFLETCLAGDYAGYRRLVTRGAEPESRARFERILNALRSLSVVSVEPVGVSQIPPPAYLVISEVDFLSERQALRRSGARKVAILVFEEEGEWRMAAAPAEFQPAAETPATSSAPTTAPDYPWDAEGDY